MTDKLSHCIYNTNGFHRPLGPEKIFFLPWCLFRLAQYCLDWLVATAESPGAPWHTSGPARDIFSKRRWQLFWVAKVKREGKITFPFWTGEVIQWGLRHNNLYKEKKEEEWRAWKFPLQQQWCTDFSSTKSMPGSTPSTPRAETSLHLNLHSF